MRLCLLKLPDFRQLLFQKVHSLGVKVVFHTVIII